MASTKTDKSKSKKIGKEVVAEGTCIYEKSFPDCKIIKKLDEFLEAQKTVSCVSGKDAGAGTVDFVDVPDYMTQLKAIDIITDIRGLRKRKLDVNHKGNLTINVVNFAEPDGNNDPA